MCDWFEAQEGDGLSALTGEAIVPEVAHEVATAEGCELLLFSFPAGFDITTLQNMRLKLPRSGATEPTTATTATGTLRVTRAQRVEFERLVPLLPSSAETGFRVGTPLAGAFFVAPDAPTVTASTTETPPTGKRRRGENGSSRQYELRNDDDVLGEETPQNSIPTTPLAELKTRWRMSGATIEAAMPSKKKKKKETPSN